MPKVFVFRSELSAYWSGSEDAGKNVQTADRDKDGGRTKGSYKRSE